MTPQITDAMVEAAARRIAHSEEFNENKWPKYAETAEWVLRGALAAATPPAQRWTLEVDDENAADVWIPNTPEAERLLRNVVERAGLGATSQVTDYPTA